MASAREKDRPKERPAPGRYFVFGSSTPRDLSHMNKVPAKLRSYDAKVRKHREGPGLKEYMEKARSLTRNDSSECRQWAFGSSTPRDLTHMTTISSAQRVYDAKSPKKSVTSPEFPTPTHKRSTTAPQPIHRVAPPPLPKRTDEDVASEPDFIQDREEFLAELHKKNAAIIEKKKKDDKKMIEKKSPEKSKAREEPKKTIAEKSKVRDEPRKSIPEKSKVSEEASKTKIVGPQFTQAHELASEVHRTERIPENLHEEESATAYRHTVTGLNDQIVVSELTEVQKDKEIVVDKDGTRKIDEFVDDKTKDILRKVENVSAEFNTNFKSFTKDLKGAATPHVESKREAFMEAEIQEPNESSDRPPKKIHNHLASKTSELLHTVDSKLTDTVTKTESIVENLHQNILDDLRNTTNTSNRDEKKAPQLIIGDMPSKI